MNKVQRGRRLQGFRRRPGQPMTSNLSSSNPRRHNNPRLSPPVLMRTCQFKLKFQAARSFTNILSNQCPGQHMTPPRKTPSLPSSSASCPPLLHGLPTALSLSSSSGRHPPSEFRRRSQASRSPMVASRPPRIDSRPPPCRPASKQSEAGHRRQRASRTKSIPRVRQQSARYSSEEQAPTRGSTE